jgi:hypothetical protein
MKLFGAHTSAASRKIGFLRNITGRIAYNPQGKRESRSFGPAAPGRSGAGARLESAIWLLFCHIVRDARSAGGLQSG